MHQHLATRHGCPEDTCLPPARLATLEAVLGTQRQVRWVSLAVQQVAGKATMAVQSQVTWQAWASQVRSQPVLSWAGVPAGLRCRPFRLQEEE